MAYFSPPSSRAIRWCTSVASATSQSSQIGFEDSLCCGRRPSVLVASGDAQLRPALLRLQDHRLPLARQVFEAVGLEQRPVELSTLLVAHLRQRRVADDLPDAAAKCDARHSRSLGPLDSSI